VADPLPPCCRRVSALPWKSRAQQSVPSLAARASDAARFLVGTVGTVPDPPRKYVCPMAPCAFLTYSEAVLYGRSATGAQDEAPKQARLLPSAHPESDAFVLDPCVQAAGGNK
jgi:hypothetical protein